jgi:Ran GTPase-activating protein (RanGAP) involved in mRNA processing and transport
MRRFLTDSTRRGIDQQINAVVISHKSERAKTSVAAETSPCRTEEDLIAVRYAGEIYDLKCEDLEIMPNDGSRQRFIDQVLGGMKKKGICLSGLGISHLCVAPLVGLLQAIPRLIYVDLSLNRLRRDGIMALAHFLAADPDVTYLDIRSNAIPIDGSIWLFRALYRNSRLAHLDLSAIDGIDRNRIGTQGCRQLAKVLQWSHVLSHLTVSMCGMTAEGCALIGPALKKNDSLVHLDISSNRFGSIGAQNLFHKEGSMGLLESVLLSQNAIGDSASPAICSHLKGNTNLKVLDLGYNNFGKPFLGQLVNVLRENSVLETLILTKNRFSPDCAEYFDSLLRECGNVKNLNLAQNPLRDEGVSQICTSLLQNTTLLTLDLSETMIGKGSAPCIASVIEKHPSLTILNLNDNQITDKKGAMIAKALESNQALTKVSIRSNVMKDRSAEAFIHALSVNRTLLELDLAFNDFSFQAHVELTKAMETHKNNIEQRVVDIANRHIDHLKAQEKLLCQSREATSRERQALQAAIQERDQLKVVLASLKVRSKEQVDENDRKLEDTRQEYEKVSQARRRQLAEFNDVKQRTEEKQNEAMKQYIALATKRQQVEGRVKRAETRKLDAQIANSRIIDDLTSRLTTLKEDLRLALEEARRTKAAIVQQEVAAQRQSTELQAVEEGPAPAVTAKPKRQANAKPSTKNTKKKKVRSRDSSAPPTTDSRGEAPPPFAPDGSV